VGGLLLGLFPGLLAGQGPTALTARLGIAISNRYAEGGPERGPALGLSVERGLGQRIGLEASVGTAVFGVSEVIPTCLPETVAGCHRRVMAPGQLVSGSLGLRIGLARGLALLTGAGVTHSLSFSEDDTDSNTTAATLHAGISWHPSGSAGRGPGVELIGARFSREIGSLRWLLTPALVWRF
jgi:hypothetical protein